MNKLYTAGYGAGWKPEQLQAEVQRLRATLWDIRHSPRSRMPAWDGSALRSLIGPAYIHMAPLGNRNYQGGDIELVNPAAAVEPARLVLSRRPLILLCGCRDPQSCHRSEAADFLAVALGVEVEHLAAPVAAATSGMKALTLTQPWATLLAIGAKQIETRSWETSYSGPLAIHAGKGLDPVGGVVGLGAQCSVEPFWSALRQAGYKSSAELPRAAIVAVVDLVECVSTNVLAQVPEIGRHLEDGTPRIWLMSDQERAFGDYSPGRYGWLFDGLQRVQVPCRGAQGLWDVPADVVSAIEAQIGGDS